MFHILRLVFLEGQLEVAFFQFHNNYTLPETHLIFELFLFAINPYFARPTFNLIPSVTYASGTGQKNSPIRITI